MNYSDWITAPNHVLRPEARTLIERGIKIGAIRLDPTSGIELKSGRLSPYFFNSGGFATGSDLQILAEAYASAIRHPLMNSSNAIYGPPYKGIPLATMVAMVMGGNFLACSSRKEMKDHGDVGIGLLGSPAGKLVILVDDVMSTGDSAAEALTYIERHKGIAVGAVIAFDRQERAKDGDFSATQDFEARYALPVRSAANLDDLIVYLREEGGHEEILEAIYQYRRQYGVLPKQ